MTAYKILKEMGDEEKTVLINAGVIPLPFTQKILIYEYYLSVFESLGGRYGCKEKAKTMTAEKYRVSIPSVNRAIYFCEGC